VSDPAASAAPAAMDPTTAVVFAGLPTHGASLYHRIRFLVGDPTALIELPATGGRTAPGRLLLIRDIEMDRARRHARVDAVHAPAEFTPEGGLSGDRELATAQALAECLRRHEIARVVSDRSLPLVYVDAIRRAGMVVELDPELGIADRRSKDEQEIQWLAEAQAATEEAIEMACRMIARADTGAGGVLFVEGSVLTSERVRAAIDVHLLERGYENPGSIVAGGPRGADCHDRGEGPLRTGEPVIIDVFPRNRTTRYNGDCTRTVVHGEVPELVARMHAAVLEAKAAAIGVARPGTSGEDVHAAAVSVLEAHGFAAGSPDDARASR